MQCCSIKLDGNQCTIRSTEIRCKIHEAKYQITGPNATRVTELRNIHTKNIREIYRAHPEARETRRAEIRAENIRYLTAVDALMRSIQELGQQNDDDPFVARRLARIEERRQARFRLMENQPRQPVPIRRELEAFALDTQNVHTTVVVDAVKHTIAKVLEIPVPIEYRSDTMKTLTEIIDQCQPSRKAVWQMTAKFCNDEDIYDMGPGIYAKVLNSVWQYIKSSEHGEDLKKILSSELVDCIGMCAQGNLSRICNVLSGYMEGLEIRSSREILQDKLAQLMEIDDVTSRVQVGRAILHNAHIPVTEWTAWLEALEG